MVSLTWHAVASRSSTTDSGDQGLLAGPSARVRRPRVPPKVSCTELTGERTDHEHHLQQRGAVELAQSIRELGVIQPVTVRKLGYDRYQLISGERRFRASQAAGLSEIPAFIRIANDEEFCGY